MSQHLIPSSEIITAIHILWRGSDVFHQKYDWWVVMCGIELSLGQEDRIARAEMAEFESQRDDSRGERDDLLITQLCDSHSIAFQENPELIKFLSSIFLKFRHNDFESANERLGNYISWRRQVLGSLQEQSIDNNETLRNQIQSLFLTVLPNSMPNGEAILYLELKRHDSSIYSAEDTVKTWHYLVMRALRKDPELATRGFYVTGNLTNISYYNLDIRVPQAVVHAVSDCMPVRVVSFFLINPPYIAQIILPVIRMLLSSKLSQRLNIITDYSHFQELYHMPPTCLPEAIGGTISEDIFRHIVSTIVSENLIV